MTVAEPILELALTFHHAVLGADEQVAGSIARLRELTRGGDYAYYTGIAYFMAGLPLDEPSGTVGRRTAADPTAVAGPGHRTARVSVHRTLKAWHGARRLKGDAFRSGPAG
ncbi:hypothetical protein [Streptomyces avermitilis]|uniref:hypothetical protein n=1 Tax=Streptomyces avermitilis TaxID=33903 RepID=UPI0033D79F41